MPVISGLTPTRVAVAAVATALYLLLLAGTLWRVHRERRRRAADAAALATDGGTAADWLVVHASQTGTATELAWRTADTLHAAGLAVRVLGIAQLDGETLARAHRALFVASTYGEGDPPDGATVFVRQVMSAAPSLGTLHYGLLALGDHEYRNFCGFGRTLDEWLQSRGAHPLFARVEASNVAPAALAQWQQHLVEFAGADAGGGWQPARFDAWRLVRRERLNDGSAGEPLFDLQLQPADGAPLPHWEAGDLAQVIAPADPERPRDYSIASLPDEGHLRLLVRLHRRADGMPGTCAGWLCTQMQPGATLPLRLRAHPNFREGDNAARPLVLIGNGTGLAGLRCHLQARSLRPATRNWLLFGERNAAHDALLDTELVAWLRAGVLTRLDRVYSRDPPQRAYVQDRLRECGEELRRWIDDGAALYVCGSLEGMAAGVDAALNEVLGEATVAQLAAAGRYRRDVY